MVNSVVGCGTSDDSEAAKERKIVSIKVLAQNNSEYQTQFFYNYKYQKKGPLLIF